jgi:hypothetical protein
MIFLHQHLFNFCEFHSKIRKSPNKINIGHEYTPYSLSE